MASLAAQTLAEQRSNSEARTIGRFCGIAPQRIADSVATAGAYPAITD
jgi:hypothetical protein